MCPETRPPSPIVRFLDSFLQERNIKWVLAVGMSILLGSSLLLVTTHWDSYTLLWQTLIVLGYSVAIHASGQWTYHRLGLRRTGLFLQGLTVLLIPILFLAVRWLPEHAADESPPGYLQWVLFAATAAFAIPAARRVFAFFLRSTQPTFLVCYLILSMSGALLSLTPDGFGPLAAAGLWATFAIGTMKASRHVFWLAEEHRKPRVFGFLPIALLGAQFLGLYAIHPALHVDLDWLGFGCMLVAIPVLATADALARVFEQRTGNLVRPLPWSVLAPIFVGLTLCSAAMALSAIDLFRPAQPAALLATTVGVSGLLLLLARRTGKEAFVWAMLFGLTLAYFLSPRFFAEAVNSLKAQGALAVNESKLPVAFYGVTFLPLLVTLLVVGKFAERTRCELFARPMRWFAFGLTCAFWMLSLTHVKAIFPVGVVLVVLTAAQLQVLRFWPALFVGLAAWVSAAFGFAVFANEVLGWTSLAGSQFVALAVAGFGLLAIGRLRDKWLSDKFPATLRLSLPDPCALTSLVLTLFLASCWLATNARIEPTSTGVMIAGLLTLHAAMRRSTPLAAIAVLFAQTVAVRTLYVAGPSASPFVTNVTLMLLGEWIVGSVLERFGRSATLNLFVGVHQRIVAVWLTFVTAAIHLPTFLLDCGNLTTGLLCPYGIDWPCRVGVLLWTFDCVRRWRSSLPAALAYFDLLAFVGCVWVAVVEPFAPEGLPIVWALTGLAASVGLTVSRRYVEKDIRQRTATALNVAIFSIIAATSLMTFDGPSRVAGMLAFVGLAWTARSERFVWARLPLAMLLNFQLLAFVPTIVCSGLTAATIADQLAILALPLALASALSLVAWRFIPTPGDDLENDLAIAFRGMLSGLWLAGMLASVQQPALVGVQVALAIGAFALAALSEFSAACRTGIEARVWTGEALIAAAAAYLLHFGVLGVHHGIAMYTLLGLALVMKTLKECAGGIPAIAVLARPFGTTAFLLPMVAVLVGVGRHFLAPVDWLGGNSLAILLAAGFYFWRAIEERRKGLYVLAAAILNIALALLWRELTWSDWQLFLVPIGITIMVLVELLRREIPSPFRDPLRYLGALVILVSPTVHIVGESWVPMLTLMIASTVIILVAIGLRVRALLYTGAAFLFADLAAILVRGSFENANLLWIAGLLLGGGIVALGAYCEKHREDLVNRMHLLAYSLKTWN